MRKKLIIISIIALFVFTGAGVTLGLNGYFGGGGKIPEDTVTRGLVGYWNFDEGTGVAVNDASDSNNDGVLTFMATGPTPWVAGKAGNGGALKFDGTDDKE